MPHQEIRVREAVRSSVPNLRLGTHKTTSSALHDFEFKGDLQPWPDFLTHVEKHDKDQIWNNQIIKLTTKSRDLDDGTFEIGDEAGVQGRFQHIFGEPLGEIFKAQSIDMHFANFKCVGRAYTCIPDMVLINNNEIKVVGELKTPWVIEHQMHRRYYFEEQLREFLGQPIKYMHDLDCMYGFISTYNETIFLRQLQHQGQWRVEYSPIIKSSTCYVKSNLHNPPPNPIVSVKQCFLWLAAIASPQGPVFNQTPGQNWVN